MKRATIHFDGGGQSPGPVTAACTVELSDGSFKEDVKRFDQGTHNIAEWQALILGLRMALERIRRYLLPSLPAQGEIPIDELRRADLRAAQDALLRRRLAKTTIDGAFSALSAHARRRGRHRTHRRQPRRPAAGAARRSAP